ncbi:hypothetical protein, partial [Aliivibrio fischeri]|uniref:hypothetical protein n=1 Tax=Aliivibrio fischeri TaxID=668 RepID=UPI001BE46F95
MQAEAWGSVGEQQTLPPAVNQLLDTLTNTAHLIVLLIYSSIVGIEVVVLLIERSPSGLHSMRLTFQLKFYLSYSSLHLAFRCDFE